MMWQDHLPPINYLKMKHQIYESCVITENSTTKLWVEGLKFNPYQWTFFSKFQTVAEQGQITSKKTVEPTIFDKM